MKIRLRHFGTAVLAFSLAATPACTAINDYTAKGTGNRVNIQNTANPGGADVPQANSASGGVQALGAEEGVIPLKSIDNKQYVPIRELTNLLQFETDWDPSTKTLRIGDTDAPYAITIDSKKAERDGDPIMLLDSPVQQGDAMYLSVSAVADLLGDEISYDVQQGRMVLHPSNAKIVDPNSTDAGQDDPQLDFSDDPKDPFKGPPSDENTGAELPAAALRHLSDMPVSGLLDETEARAVALRNIDINGLIRKGKQYLGVRYKFGASPYPVSGRFDCSTFTQYLFGKYGISLPRLARQQAARGTTVSRKSLRKGDLMFFYVPGRFKNNRKVGNVGIYIGNGQMLNANSTPKDGVQITNINKPYWKRVYLFSKRIVY